MSKRTECGRRCWYEGATGGRLVRCHQIPSNIATLARLESNFLTPNLSDFLATFDTSCMILDIGLCSAGEREQAALAYHERENSQCVLSQYDQTNQYSRLSRPRSAPLYASKFTVDVHDASYECLQARILSSASLLTRKTESLLSGPARSKLLKTEKWLSSDE